MTALLEGSNSSTSCFVTTPESLVNSYLGVPQYYDRISVKEFERYVQTHLQGFTARTLGDLEDAGIISIRMGMAVPPRT